MTLKELGVFEQAYFDSVLETDWAWLACAIDGEGNLRVFRNGNHYQAVLRIFNTNHSFVEKVANITLENINGKNGDTPLRTKTCWYVQIGKGSKLYYILQKALPYLTAKKRLAELVIEYIELRMSNFYYTGKEEQIVRICEGVMERGGA